MMGFRITYWIGLLLCLLAFTLPSSALTVDELFNGDRLHEVRIYIHPDDLATLKRNIDICPAQDLAALAGERVSNLPRIECWFSAEFHWIFNGRDITTPQV